MAPRKGIVFFGLPIELETIYSSTALPGSSLDVASPAIEHEHGESPGEENPESECEEASDPCVEPEDRFVYNLVLHTQHTNNFSL